MKFLGKEGDVLCHFTSDFLDVFMRILSSFISRVWQQSSSVEDDFVREVVFTAGVYDKYKDIV